jgi:hypothetical protein
LMKLAVMSTTLVFPMQALTQCSLQTAIMSLRNLWPYWIVHFEHFAQGGRLVVLDREPRSYQGESRETRWNDSRSPFQWCKAKFAKAVLK